MPPNTLPLSVILNKKINLLTLYECLLICVTLASAPYALLQPPRLLSAAYCSAHTAVVFRTAGKLSDVVVLYNYKADPPWPWQS